MSWEGIEGHDQIANRFSLAEAAGRIAGSYLFVGQEGIGKATFAKALTMALACEDSGNSLAACHKCNSCIQALAGTHPDIDIVQKPTERTTIPLTTPLYSTISCPSKLNVVETGIGMKKSIP